MHRNSKTEQKKRTMKTANNLFDNMLEAQTAAWNTWVDTTKKFQNAFISGNLASEGQSIYKEWFDKQMGLMGGLTSNGSHFDFSKPEEFFKNWYNQQLEYSKRITDFNQSLYNSFSNFGKQATDYANNFNNMNAAWTNIYNNWMNTLNNTYQAYSRFIPNPTNQEAFKNLFESNQIMLKLKEMWEPAFKAWQSGEFNHENFKNYFQPDYYKNLSEKVFSGIFTNASLKEAFDASLNTIQQFFSTNNDLARQYAESVQNIAKEYPSLVSGDFAKLNELYHNVNNVFARSFEPLLKVATPGKEKETIEANIALLDKISEFSVKQAKLQQHFYLTGQKATEEAMKKAFDRLSNNSNEVHGFNDFYNEWVKVNEDLFTQLFSSDDFSKIKAEVISLGLDVKKHFEKQFESVFSAYPIAFRSEVDELNKEIYELKKKVKALENKLAMGGAELEEDEKSAKTARKK